MEPTSLEALHALSPDEFEGLVKQVFEGLGYQVEVTKGSGDEGVDLVLTKGDERSIAQCKRYKGQVGQPVVRDFYGTVVHEGAARGYLITSGTFSLRAETWAAGKNLVLVDGPELVGAMRDMSIDLEPQVTASAESRRDPFETLLEQVREEGPRAVLPVIFEGEPPAGHSYEELGQVLAARLGGTHIYVDVRMRSPRAGVAELSLQQPFQIVQGQVVLHYAGELLFFDELDVVKRGDIDFVISLLEKPREYTHAEFVNVAASSWAGRLPVRLLRLFRTRARASDINWASVKSALPAAREQLRRLKEEQERRRKEEERREEQRRREEQKRREDEVKRRGAEERRLRAEDKERQLREAEEVLNALYQENVQAVALKDRRALVTQCRFCGKNATAGAQRLVTGLRRGWFSKEYPTYEVRVCRACRKRLAGLGPDDWQKDRFGRFWRLAWVVPGNQIETP